MRATVAAIFEMVSPTWEKNLYSDDPRCDTICIPQAASESVELGKQLGHWRVTAVFVPVQKMVSIYHRRRESLTAKAAIYCGQNF